MATVERSSQVHANFADTERPDRHKLVGRIGPWQLVRLLSESEMARVYVARPADAANDQPANYVVKVLRKEWWRDPQAIEMQRRAAWLGRAISHPHLLPVLSANVGQAPFYFITPKLNAQSLAEMLTPGSSLPLPITLWIARQVAEALAALHDSTGMIHADVKPSNILVSPEGHATLIDLGFAHSATEGQHWSSRPVVGTLNYIAPEAITSSLSSEPSSDLYSLGVTLYEMIAGQLPFDAAYAGRTSSDASRIKARVHPTSRAQAPQSGRLTRASPLSQRQPPPPRLRRGRRRRTNAARDRML